MVDQHDTGCLPFGQRQASICTVGFQRLRAIVSQGPGKQAPIGDVVLDDQRTDPLQWLPIALAAVVQRLDQLPIEQFPVGGLR